MTRGREGPLGTMRFGRGGTFGGGGGGMPGPTCGTSSWTPTTDLKTENNLGSWYHGPEKENEPKRRQHTQLRCN